MVLLACLTGFTLSAATYHVTNTEDDGSAGTLRWAIEQANDNPGPDTIAFDVWGDFYLISPLPALNDATGGTCLDGTTAPAFVADSFTPQPSIYLRGAGSGSGVSIASVGNEIRALGILGFSTGIEITGGESNFVRGSIIGYNQGFGVRIENSSGNLIGGENAADRNMIWSNAFGGIGIVNGDRNSILSNMIYGNGGPGIDLGADGTSANDSGDLDVGANGLQNAPSLLIAHLHPDVYNWDTGGTNHPVRVWGRLESTPNTEFLIQLHRTHYFSRFEPPHGDFIGQTTVRTDSSGMAVFAVDGSMVEVPHHLYLPHFRATATDSFGNTSEFSDLIEPTRDRDGDGIANQIDGFVSETGFVDESEIFSDRFTNSEIVLGAATSGRIETRNGLLLAITPEWVLDGGISIFAGGPAEITEEVTLDCEAVPITITGSTWANLTCGSILAQVQIGLIQFAFNNDLIVRAGSFTDLKISSINENFVIKNNSASSELLIESSGQQDLLPPGDFEVTGANAIRVDIDVKPGHFPNAINPSSNGSTAVAVLGGPSLDVTRVTLPSLQLENAPVLRRRNGSVMADILDLNRDNYPDLVFHVQTSAIEASAADPDVTLVAETIDGKMLIGLDTVKIAPR